MQITTEQNFLKNIFQLQLRGMLNLIELKQLKKQNNNDNKREWLKFVKCKSYENCPV